MKRPFSIREVPLFDARSAAFLTEKRRFSSCLIRFVNKSDTWLGRFKCHANFISTHESDYFALENFFFSRLFRNSGFAELTFRSEKEIKSALLFLFLSLIS